MLDFLKARGPSTVRRISSSLDLPKNRVRGILWHSDHTTRTDRAPACRRKKPIWSWSPHKVSHLVLRPALKEHEDEDH